MTYLTNFFKSPKVFVLFVFLYGIGALTSRSIMEFSASFFVIQTLIAVFFLWDPRMTVSRRAALVLALLYVSFHLLRLSLLPRISLKHLVVPDLLFFLVPFSFLNPLLEFNLKKVAGWLHKIAESYLVVFASIAAVVLLTSIYQIFIKGAGGATGLMRITIFAAYGQLALLSLVLALLYVRFRVGRFGGTHFLILASVLLVSIVLTSSRTATLVGVLMWLAVALPRIFDRYRWRGLLLSLAGLATCISVLLVVNPVAFERYLQVTRRRDEAPLYMSLRSREFLWRHNRELFEKNRFFGVGYRQNVVRPHRDFPEEVGVNFSMKPQAHLAHSLYWQSLAEGGLLGTALLLLALGALCISLPISAFVFAAVLLSGSTDSPLSSPKMFHPIFFSILMLFILSCLEPGIARLRKLANR